MEEITRPFALFASLIPAVCGLSYGIILIFNRESRARRVLGIIFFVSGLCWGNTMIVDSVYHTGGRAPVFNTWHILSNLVVWPVVRWYLVLLLRPDAKFFPRYFRQFYPFFISLSLVFIVRGIWGKAPDTYSVREFVSLLGHYPEFMLRVAILVAFLVQIAIFYMLTSRELKEHQQRIRDDFSDLDKVDLGWVRWINYLCCFFGVAINLTLAFSGGLNSRMWINVSAFFFLGTMAVVGGTKKDIYYLPDPNVELDRQKIRQGMTALLIPPGMKYPPIKKTTYRTIRENLIKLLEVDEVYTQKNLRLDDLALKLSTNKTYVSMAINEQFKTNFYTVINHYRINKAIRLLSQTDEQIKSVWMKSGFNSQSSFNTAFKKEMGISPSEWVMMSGKA